MEEKILIAILRRAHGIKGEVFAVSHTFDNSRFKKLKEVELKPMKGESLRFHISGSRITPKGILLSFKEISTRTEAEKLKGAEIYIPISERLKLPKNKLYYDEIIGMKVVDNDSGEELGSIKTVNELPSGDIFTFALKDGSERLVTSTGNEIIGFDKKK